MRNYEITVVLNAKKTITGYIIRGRIFSDGA